MNVLKIRIIIVIVFLFILASNLLLGCIGSPEFTIIFENKTQQTVSVFIDEYNLGELNPEDQINYDNVLWDHGRYLIEAVNLQGVTIYSQTHTPETMERMESRVYKVIITSSESPSETQ